MDAEVVRVVSNRPEAHALRVASSAGVPSAVVPSAGRSREEHEADLRGAIDEARPDLVCLAGYMRILTPAFIRAYEGRLLNIHPSLLPAFPGMDAQAQAHARDVRIAGCTVHFVTEDVDAGPILAQAAVALPPGLGVDDARGRILDAEHTLYPRAVQLLASGRARYHAGRVVHGATRGAPEPTGVLFSP